jgi:hypothetical protein
VDGIVRQVEERDILRNKRNVRRDERSERPTKCRLLFQAGNDESPVSRPDQKGSDLGYEGKEETRSDIPSKLHNRNVFVIIG